MRVLSGGALGMLDQSWRCFDLLARSGATRLIRRAWQIG